MDLAYGDPPPPLPLSAAAEEEELQGLMSKLDALMLEAHCIQHSATTIIASLQQNPEAMAAVALTLAEISSLITKMSPGILTAIKGSSPAIFALLASPQFLIAGGLAIGVTVVMFGGYKIIKKIQKNAEKEREANRMEEAMAYEGDLGSIEHWRRGIAEVEAQSVATSVDGEFITPEAARQKKERIRERAKEERRDGESVAGSERTVRGKGVPVRSSSQSVVSESVRGERLRKESKEKKSKKSSALTVLFKKGEKGEKGEKKGGKAKEKERGKEREKERERSHRPKMIEI
jgi:hypothetical protein